MGPAPPADPGAWHVLYGPHIIEGQWTHLAGTFDGIEGVLFVNGAVVAREAFGYSPNTSRPLRIGAGATEGLAEFFFTGEVDEVAVYDRALTAAQIQSHYAAAALPFRLSVERGAEGPLLTWGSGRLQQADAPEGPWEPVDGASSPYNLSAPGTARRFYRVQLR